MHSEPNPLPQLARQHPARAIEQLITTMHAAGTAEVQLVSEPTDPAASGGFDKVLEGVVDFRAGRAVLKQTAGGSGEPETTLVIGGCVYRSSDEKGWVLVSENEGDRENLTLEGFGLVSLARGARETLEVTERPRGGLVLRVVSKLTAFYDDLAATDILQVPTALMPEPLVATITTDTGGRITEFSVESAKERPHLKVQRRRFVLRLSNFGLRVDISEPESQAVTAAPPRRSLRSRVLRRLGAPT